MYDTNEAEWVDWLFLDWIVDNFFLIMFATGSERLGESFQCNKCELKISFPGDHSAEGDEDL